MNKTKMILAAIGGVIGLAVLVTAALVWFSLSAKTAAVEGDDEEGTDGLDTVVARAQQLSRKPVYPCAASVKEIESNRTAVVTWREEATKLATRGDRVFPSTTPAAFKTFIVGDAKRLANLPGAVAGVLVKPEFTFGPFKDYIAGGKMPVDSELAGLQRQWDDVATVVEILATSGIAELTDIAFKASEQPQEETKRGKRNRRPSRAEKADEDRSQPAANSYVFTFSTKPAAFVKALNAFAVSERFITVDGVTFTRTKDTIAEALGGDEQKAEAAGRRGRRGRRGRVEAANPLQAEGDEPAPKSRIVTDPLLDAPMSVVLTVTISDFHSLENAEKEGASK